MRNREFDFHRHPGAFLVMKQMRMGKAVRQSSSGLERISFILRVRVVVKCPSYTFSFWEF